MEEKLERLEGIYRDYREEIAKAEEKLRPTDGIFGFGASLSNDACHQRLDERLRDAVGEICALSPSSSDAERAAGILLRSREADFPQNAARWMLRAAERHALPLIPFLDRDAAFRLWKDYEKRYRPWERLPVQRELVAEMKKRAK